MNEVNFESDIGNSVANSEDFGADSESETEELSDIFDQLFPLCRSISGPGYEASLDILTRYMPFRRHQFESGTRALDWTVPPAWRIKSATLTGPDGKVYVDFADSNLHVVNYSIPVDQKLTLDELQPHLHSLPNFPTAIPYVTSYYKKRWGFCLPDEVRKTLPPGTWHARIDSELYEGAVVCADLTLPGKSSREFLITSYLCHPSLANNELSGPLTMLALYRRLAKRHDRQYTYRFLLIPETIGSICYLSRFGDALKKQLNGGLVLTCTGGPREQLSYKTSRRENTLLDRLIENLSEKESGITIRPFTPINGSDERQFCSPGFNLPVGQISRTVYTEYDGYHNSLDNKEFMGIERLVESANDLDDLLRMYEHAGCFINTQPFGEVQLGRRNLYPTVNSAATWDDSNDNVLDSRTQLNHILYLLNYCDGHHDMVWIANRIGCTVKQLIPTINRLQAEGLLVRQENVVAPDEFKTQNEK